MQGDPAFFSKKLFNCEQKYHDRNGYCIGNPPKRKALTPKAGAARPGWARCSYLLGTEAPKPGNTPGVLLPVGRFQAPVSMRVHARLTGSKLAFFSRFCATGGTTNDENVFLLGSHMPVHNN
jgi:hypothetical protein